MQAKEDTWVSYAAAWQVRRVLFIGLKKSKMCAWRFHSKFDSRPQSRVLAACRWKRRRACRLLAGSRRSTATVGRRRARKERLGGWMDADETCWIVDSTTWLALVGWTRACCCLVAGGAAHGHGRAYTWSRIELRLHTQATGRQLGINGRFYSVSCTLNKL